MVLSFLVPPLEALTLIASLFSQQPATQGEFIGLRGADTITFERFTRDANTLKGEFVQRGLYVQYTARLRADQFVEHFEFTARRNGRPESGRFDFSPTRIIGERNTGGVSSAIDMATTSLTLPAFVGATALLEQAVRATKPAAGRDTRIPVFRIFAAPAQADTSIVRRITSDSLMALVPEAEFRIAIDRDGSIRGASAARIRVERRAVTTISLAARFPQVDVSAWSAASPEVPPDRTVTLRLTAPTASNVKLAFRGERPMSKDSSGVWSATVGPLAPDIYSYEFIIDESWITDPQNPSGMFEIPGSDPLPWSVRPVPHGAVTAVWYHSKALAGAFRAVKVYTPPGYESSAEQYPVLYLLHGAGGDESSWSTTGRANLVLDNLIADGKARPMIVVMPAGHVEQNRSLGLPEGARIPADRTFGDDLLGDIMPLIEQRFRVSHNADQRAIAGLSMGGAQAIEIGLTNTDRFHWIAGFSSALYVAAYSSFAVQRRVFSLPPEEVASLNRQIKLLWIACGKDDGLLSSSERFVNTLKERGVRHTFVTTEGAHQWGVWRRNLVELVPLLFRS